MERPEVVERFTTKWVLTPEGCHQWTAGKSSNGRPFFWFGGKTLLAHRVAWYLTHGEWPKTMLCHTCDNPLCVNTDHLFEGSAADNSADMVRKKRSASGSRHPHSKITEVEAASIRTRRAAGETYRAIAADFPISLQAVHYICSGRNWKPRL